MISSYAPIAVWHRARNKWQQAPSPVKRGSMLVELSERLRG